jgi:hypothetical protein
MRRYVRPSWVWRKPSETCEHRMESRPCGEPAVSAYAAMGGGYMALCKAHGWKHRDITVTMEEARRGVEVPAALRASLPVRAVTPVRSPDTRDWRALRQAAGISVASAARQAGVKASTLRAYESQRMPRSTAARLMNVYRAATLPEGQ